MSETDVNRLVGLRNIEHHCHGFVTLKEKGVLQTFISKLNELDYND